MRLERLTAPSIVRLHCIEVSTSVAVQLNVGLVLVVLVRLAGELRVRVGAVVSTVKVWIAEVVGLFRSSLQTTCQVCVPCENAEVAVVV